MIHQDGLLFFSTLVSELGGLLIARETTTTTPADNGPVSTLTTMVQPTTITVNTTLLRTSFVTITTSVARPTSTPCTDSRFPYCSGEDIKTPTIDRNTSLPKIVTSNPTGTTLASIRSRTTQHASTTGMRKASSTTTSASATSINDSQRHAIIGGLSGTIAGLVLIGVVLCVFLRRRQRREVDNETGSERSLRRTLTRSWSQFTTARAKSRTPPTSSGVSVLPQMPPMSRQSSAGDFNGSILRVSMGHWPRPFAHHESFRESAGPGRLRVVNPDDVSRSTTPAPRGSMESGATYLRRQRSAMKGALFAGNHSRASSNAPSRQRSRRISSITVDYPPLPPDSAARKAAAASSFRSQPSVASSQTVEQQPLEDPFLTPPEGSIEENEPRPQRPSLATIQSAAGAAQRSLSHLGQALNPFRSRPQPMESCIDQRQSSTTFSSDGDPFRLDRASILESELPRPAEPAHIQSRTLYHGAQ